MGKETPKTADIDNRNILRGQEPYDFVDRLKRKPEFKDSDIRFNGQDYVFTEIGEDGVAREMHLRPLKKLNIRMPDGSIIMEDMEDYLRRTIGK